MSVDTRGVSALLGRRARDACVRITIVVMILPIISGDALGGAAIAQNLVWLQRWMYRVLGRCPNPSPRRRVTPLYVMQRWYHRGFCGVKHATLLCYGGVRNGGGCPEKCVARGYKMGGEALRRKHNTQWLLRLRRR